MGGTQPAIMQNRNQEYAGSPVDFFGRVPLRDARRCPAWQPAEASCHLATAGSQRKTAQDPRFASWRRQPIMALPPRPLFCVSPRRRGVLGGRAEAIARCGPSPDAGRRAVAARLRQHAWKSREAKMAASAAGLGGGMARAQAPNREISWRATPGVQQAQEAVPAEAERGRSRRQFAQLGRELRAQECLPYAAWCPAGGGAPANRRSSTGPARALAALTEAARLFLRRERDARQRLACPPPPGGPTGRHGRAGRCRAPAPGARAASRGRRALPRAGGCPARPGPAGRRRRPLQRAAQLQLPSCPGLQALGHATSTASCWRGITAARWHSSRTCSAWRGSLAAPAAAPAAAAPTCARAAVRRPAALAPPLRPALGRQPPPPRPRWVPSPTCWSAARCPACCCFCSCSRRPPSSCRSMRTPWRSTPGRLSTATGRTAWRPAARGAFPAASVLGHGHTREKDRRRPSSCSQVEMWPLLSAEQNHLLHLVLQETVSHRTGDLMNP